MQTFLVIDLNEQTLFLHSIRDRKHMRVWTLYIAWIFTDNTLSKMRWHDKDKETSDVLFVRL